MDNQKQGERTSVRNTIQIASLLALVSTGLLAINTLSAGYLLTSAGLLAGFLISAITLVLARKGNLGWPSFILPAITLVITTYLVVVGEGIRDEGILGYTLVIALAGLLLGRRGALTFTAISILVISLLGIAQLGNWGFLVNKPDFAALRIAVIAILLAFQGALIYIIIRNLEYTVTALKEREENLAASHHALSEFQATLEARIAERVRNANQAREDAEAARHALEQNAWQTAGLAALGDVMRSDQDLNSLANAVIQQLCQYLPAQAGLLFLLEDQVFKLYGCFACSPDQADQVEKDAGLVGQAVREKKILQLSGIQADLLQVKAGLGSIRPEQILIVPFLYAGEVAGLIELAAVKTLPDKSLELLAQAAERIAVTFQTAQTRAQIDQLLEQAQAQAEELATREEELRTMNEELEAQAENLRLANLEFQKRGQSQ